MLRKPVKSSTIASIGHEFEVLEIEFLSGGIYQYSGVPVEVHDALMAAPSHGSYFSRFVRNKYETKKVDG